MQLTKCGICQTLRYNAFETDIYALNTFQPTGDSEPKLTLTNKKHIPQHSVF